MSVFYFLFSQLTLQVFPTVAMMTQRCTAQPTNGHSPRHAVKPEHYEAADAWCHGGRSSVVAATGANKEPAWRNTTLSRRTTPAAETQPQPLHNNLAPGQKCFENNLSLSYDNNYDNNNNNNIRSCKQRRSLRAPLPNTRTPPRHLPTPRCLPSESCKPLLIPADLCRPLSLFLDMLQVALLGLSSSFFTSFSWLPPPTNRKKTKKVLTEQSSFLSIVLFILNDEIFLLLCLSAYIITVFSCDCHYF